MLLGVAVHLMLLFYRENGEPPKKIAVYTHVAGNNLVLPCAVTGTPRPTVTWYRENAPIEHRFVKNDGMLSLRLNANELSIQGTQYHCTATNRFGNHDMGAVLRSRSVNVTLAYFNGFQSTIARTVVVDTVIGGPVALKCDFSSSNPAPEVMWYDNLGSLDKAAQNDEVFYLEGGRYLLIKGLTSVQRSRRYHCEVTNFGGSHVRAPTTYALNRDLPIGGFVSYLGLETQIGKIGEVLTLAYVAAGRDSDGNSMHYALKCDSNDLLTVVIQNSIILHVTLLEAAATVSNAVFTCSVVGLGATRLHRISGTVRVARDMSPFIVDPLFNATFTDRERKVGSNVLYNCATSTERPPGIVVWYHNGEVILSGSEDRVIHSNGTLIIQAAQISHTGIYQCFTTNRFGSDMRTWILEVRDGGWSYLQQIQLAESQSDCFEESSVFTCRDPRHTILFDGVRPELVRLDGSERVGNHLHTLRSNMVNMTFEFDIPQGFTGVRRVEMELLNCEEVGVTMRSIVFSASGVFMGVLRPPTSCDKLVRVCIPLSTAATSSQMALHMSTRNPSDWIAVSSINFYTGHGDCEAITTDDIFLEGATFINETIFMTLNDSCSSFRRTVTVITFFCTATIASIGTLIVEFIFRKVRKCVRNKSKPRPAKIRKKMSRFGQRIAGEAARFGNSFTSCGRATVNGLRRLRKSLSAIAARIRHRYPPTREEVADGVRSSYSHSREALSAMTEGFRNKTMGEGIRHGISHSMEAVASMTAGLKYGFFAAASKKPGESSSDSSNE